MHKRTTKQQPAGVSSGQKIKTPIQLRLFPLLAILLIVLPILSWKIAKAQRFPSDTIATNIVQPKAGPWGNLEYTRIAIEIPDHFVNVEEIDPTEWIFNGISRDELIAFFKSCALTGAQFDSLVNKTPWKQTDGEYHISPSDEFLWSLSATSRATIYSALAQFEENVDQYYAFSYRPERLGERFEFSGLSEDTVSLFKKLLYPQGSMVRFADSDLVLRRLTDRKERLRFVKTISRRATLLVKLNVTPQADIDALISYWGIGGRAKDLRPLLESLARVSDGCKIDIAHLLPPFARSRIYTYPNESTADSSLRQDCHWTSLNFFNESPTEGFSSPEDIQKIIEKDYEATGEGMENARFGDVIFLKNSQDLLIHSAVYIADDIVFTKNGTGQNQPWIYMKMEDMLPYYMMPNDTVKLLVYRKKKI